MNGHPAEHVRGTYEVAAQYAPPPAPRPSKMPIWAIVLIVFVVSVPACSIFTAIAVPVFLNASANAELKSCFANERTVAGAAATYQVMDSGAALPSEWNSLMAVLIPDVLKTEPTCPSGGTYSVDSSDGSIAIDCSIHGNFDDVE